MYSNTDLLIQQAIIAAEADRVSLSEGSLTFLLVEAPTVKATGDTTLKSLSTLKTIFADTLPKTSKLIAVGEKKLRGAIADIDEDDASTKSEIIELFSLAGNFASATTQLFIAIDVALKSAGASGDTLVDAIGGEQKLKAVIGKSFVPSKGVSDKIKSAIEKLDDLPKDEKDTQAPEDDETKKQPGETKLAEAEGIFTKVLGGLGDALKKWASSAETTKQLQSLFDSSITKALLADLQVISLSDYSNTIKQAQPILVKLNPVQQRLPKPIKAKSSVQTPEQGELADAAQSDVAVSNQVVKALSALDGGESLAKIIKAVIDGKQPSLDALSDKEKKFLDGLIDKLKADPASLSTDTVEQLKTIAAEETQGKTGSSEGGDETDEDSPTLTGMLFQKKSKSLRSKKNMPERALKLRTALEDAGIIKPDDKDGNKKDILDKVKAFKDAIDGVKLESKTHDQEIIERWQKLAGLR